MASRPKGYGLTAEVKGKIDSKYSESLAKEAMDWIERLVPGSGTRGISQSSEVQEKLKDGIILCKVANALGCSGKPLKVNESKMAFKQMENIGNFLEACSQYGVVKNDTFQTVDLYEGQNMPAVINGLHALGRKAASRGKPGIGPKESQRNERDFTDEQLRAGQGVIGLQMGSNKGATQAGQNFGKTRAIID